MVKLELTLEQAKKHYVETGEYRYAVVMKGNNVPLWLCAKREDAEAKVEQHHEWQPHYFVPDKTDYYVKDLKEE